MDIGKRSLLKGGMLTCKRNRSANRESLKPHRIPNPKTHWCFLRKLNAQKRKICKLQWTPEPKNRKIQSPLPVHLFIKLITPPAEQIFHFLIEVFATNKHSEYREIPFYFLFCESSRVLFLLWDILVFLKGSWVFQPLNFKTRSDVWESWLSTKLYLFSIPVLTKGTRPIFYWVILT